MVIPKEEREQYMVVYDQLSQLTDELIATVENNLEQEMLDPYFLINATTLINAFQNALQALEGTGMLDNEEIEEVDSIKVS
jgi:hypothetical protein